MSDVGGIAADHLRSFVERIERVLEEIKGLQADVKEIKAEAKATGFDVKTINAIIKLRAMTADERAEQEALLDLYKAALGMLDGTPLGNAAVDRLTKKPKPSPQNHIDQQTDLEEHISSSQQEGEGAGDEGDQQAEAELPPAPPEPTIEDARASGKQAAAAGEPVTANPWPARDPRRAAWDEAWCQAAGSDGMDLPSAWRRTTPKKPSKDGDDKKAA